MLSVEEALKRIVHPLKPVETETVSVFDAQGRVLAEPVKATRTHPPAPVSAMDGYAVCAADLVTIPASFPIAGESRAGLRYDATLGAGEAVRIFTGAVMPDGADAVVIQENTICRDGRVTLTETVPAGTFVRPAGLDIRIGDRLAEPGKRLTARTAALVSSVGTPTVRVYRKPIVAVLATGDELVMPGEPVGPDQIVSSNSVALAGYIRALGGEPRLLGIARDTGEALGDALSGIGDADMLVTVGGASVGDYDLVARELGHRGLVADFHKVAIRPGKPMISGQFGNIPMLGLPGNPVSVGVTACLFVAPALGVLAGTGPVSHRTEPARLGCDLGENDGREDYLRALCERDSNGNLVATPMARQDSSMFAVFARADCLLKRPPFAAPARTGDRVDVIRFPTGTDGF